MMAILSYLSHPLINILLKMLLLVALLVWINKLSFNARSKAMFWQIGLVFLLLLPCTQLLLPALHLPILPVMEQTPNLIPAHAVTTDFQTVKSSSFAMIEALVVLWLLISAWILFTMTRQLYRLYQITHQAEVLNQPAVQHIIDRCLKMYDGKKRPIILVSRVIDSPCTWGVINPVILLPTNMNDHKTLELVLLHEMAHIQRKDWLWLMISKLMLACFWFNPLLWFVQKQMVNSCESACDELVLQQSILPSEYAKTLLGFHQPDKYMMALTAHMAQQSLMYQRLQQILNPRRISMKKRHPSWLIASLSFAFALLSMAQLTTAQTAAQPLPDGEELADSAPVIAPSPQAPPAVPMPESEPKAAYPTAPPAPTAPAKPVMPAAPEKQAAEKQVEVVNADYPVSKLALAERTAEKQMAREAEMVRLRSERAQIQVEQQRIKAEERALKAEQLKLERNVAQLNVQRQRLEAQNLDREKIRAEEVKVRREAEKAEQHARLVRMKESALFPKVEN